MQRCKPRLLQNDGRAVCCGPRFRSCDAVVIPPIIRLRRVFNFSSRDRQRKLRETLLRQREPDRQTNRFRRRSGTPTPIEIVGVVKDASTRSSRGFPRQVFFPYQQMDEPGSAVVYVRSAQDPASAFAAVRRTMREMDINIPIYNLRTLTRQIERSLLTERIVATLSTAFGVIATLLAVIGLYGLMAIRHLAARARSACAWRSERCRATSCGSSCAR